MDIPSTARAAVVANSASASASPAAASSDLWRFFVSAFPTAASNASSARWQEWLSGPEPVALVLPNTLLTGSTWTPRRDVQSLVVWGFPPQSHIGYSGLAGNAQEAMLYHHGDRGGEGGGGWEWTDQTLKQHILPLYIPVGQSGAYRLHTQMRDGLSVAISVSGPRQNTTVTVSPGFPSQTVWEVVEVRHMPDGSGRVWIVSLVN